jgi:opacity protein-like surface antigen
VVPLLRRITGSLLNTLKVYQLVVVTFAAAIFASIAQAADFEPSPTPIETWTGFSLGVGGGVGSLNADVNSKASRTDGIGCVPNTDGCNRPGVVLREIDQNYDSSFSDLGGTGGFFTVQGAYDYQFAPRWVVGAILDADWSDISGHSKQTSNSGIQFSCPDPGNCEDDPVGRFSTSNGTIDTNVSTDWSFSVGGRIGWLANEQTLLYLLAAYTHADLSDARVKVNIPDPNDLVAVVLGGAPGTSPFPNSPTNLLMKLPDSVDGFSLGGGGEAKIGGPWSVKLEYRWTHLEGSSGQSANNKSQCCFEGKDSGNQLFREISGSAASDLSLDEQTIRGALVYHFWSGGSRNGG